MSSDHPHDDHHDHGHEPIEVDEISTHYQYLTEAVKELLIEKSVFSATDMRKAIETMDARSPAGGANVVAKAWVEPQYKARLLTSSTAAVAELGIQIEPTHLVVVENTDDVHNMVVCTLCSCYPRNLLGLPPDWYKSRSYRSRSVREPRSVLAEFGTYIPDNVEVRVHDSTADMRYIVLPQRPSGTAHMTEAELAQLVTRDTMIGVATVDAP